jgi:endonuclease G
VPAQLNHGGQLATFLIGFADRRGSGFIDSKHDRDMGGPAMMGKADWHVRQLAARRDVVHPRGMPPWLTRLLVSALAIGTPWLAQADTCDPIFAGQQPPVLLNAKLAERTTELCNEAYAALASGLTRGPLWSAEHLTVDGLARARTLPREGRFHEEERLPPDDRAMLSDYTRSGYDCGHMTPSGDMPDPEAQQQSFSLANIVPQRPMLNRDTWEGIESAVRHLAERQGELYVVTGPAFLGGQVQSLKGHVLVPTSTWKAIYDPAAPRAAAYTCTNISHPKCATLSIAYAHRRQQRHRAHNPPSP